MPISAPMVITPVPPTPATRMFQGVDSAGSAGSGGSGNSPARVATAWPRRSVPPSTVTMLGQKPATQE